MITYTMHLYLPTLAYFDPPEAQPYRSLTWSSVNTPFAQSLALTASSQSLVLLKTPTAPSHSTPPSKRSHSLARTRTQRRRCKGITSGLLPS